MTEPDCTIRKVDADMPNTEHRTTEGEIKEIWERLTAGESSIKSAHHRIDSLEKLADSVNNLAMATSQIATETKALREDYEKADERIDELEQKPAKRFEALLMAFLCAICSGIGGYFLAMLLN